MMAVFNSQLKKISHLQSKAQHTTDICILGCPWSLGLISQFLKFLSIPRVQILSMVYLFLSISLIPPTIIKHDEGLWLTNYFGTSWPKMNPAVFIIFVTNTGWEETKAAAESQTSVPLSWSIGPSTELVCDEYLTHTVGWLWCQEGQFPVFPIGTLYLVLTAAGRAFSLVQMCFGNHLLFSLCLPGFSCRRYRGLFQPSCLWFPLCWLWPACVESTPSWKVDWMEQASPVLSTLTSKSVSWHRELISILELQFETLCHFC